METYEKWRSHVDVAFSSELKELLAAHGLDSEQEIDIVLRTVYHTMIQPLLPK